MDISLPVTQIMSAGPIELNQFTSELPLKVGPKSGTSKVQLGAERAVGADSAEGRTCEFPKKIKILCKNGKNDVLLGVTPSAPASLTVKISC